jgi:hypothetical protein
MASKTITIYSCTLCGKIVTRPINSKKYVACSPECQKKLTKIFQTVYPKEVWDKMTPLEKTNARYKMKSLYLEFEGKELVKMKKYLTSEKPKKRVILKHTDLIFKAHEEVAKEDPESLTTEFMQKLYQKG